MSAPDDPPFESHGRRPEPPSDDSTGATPWGLPADKGDYDAIRARQAGRARVMALLLAGFVILMFAITIAKIRSGH